MLKQLHLKSWLLMMLLLVGGVGSASAESADYTYTLASGDFTTGTNSKTVDGITWTVTWDTSKGVGDYTSGMGFKFGSSNKSYPTTVTLTSSAFSQKISKVVVKANGNASTTAKLDVKVGETTYGSQASLTNSSTSYEFATESPITGTVNISFTNNNKPIYVDKIEVYYYSTPKTASDFTLTSDSEINLAITSVGVYPTSTVTYTTSSTGEITWATDNASVATVSNGVITAAGAGIAHITVTQADDETYAASDTKTITVNVTDDTKTATPTITVSPDVIDAATDVTVTITGAGTLYYTTDGTDPVIGSSATTTSGTPFVLNLAETTTIKAIAKEEDKKVSNVATATVTYKEQNLNVNISLNTTFFSTTDHTNGGTASSALTLTGSEDNVNVELNINKSANYYINASGIRCYPNNTLSFSAPTGYVITKIVFTKGTNWGTVTPTLGSISSQTWTGDASSVAFTFSAKTDISAAAVTLEKIQPKYALTFATDYTGGSITVKKGEEAVVSGTELKAGTELALVATPSEGYAFNGWTATAGTLADAASATTTLTTGAAAATLSAAFALQSYTLKATADANGTVAVKVNGDVAVLDGEGNVSVPYNATVTVTATPNEGYAFSAWTVAGVDDADVLTSPLEFTMPAEGVTVSAAFIDANVEYDVNIDPAITGGTVTASKATAKVGETITLTATPSEGYQFSAWDVKDASSNALAVTDNAFTMPASAVTVSAVFKQEFTVTYYVKGESAQVVRLDGEALNLPSPAATGGMEFGGWSTTEDAANANVVAADMAVTSNLTLYAMFVAGYEPGTTYDLVTADQTDWRGDYLIANSSTIFADGRVGGNDGLGKQNTKVSPGSNLTGNSVAASWGDTYNVTLEAIDDADLSAGYVMKTKDGKYNYHTKNENGLSSAVNKATAAEYPITITFTSSADVKLCLGGSAKGAVFRYNASGYFRFYKDGGQNAVYLYKKANGSAIYSLGTPVDVTISAAEYATFCSTQSLDFSGTDVTVYTAKATDSAVELTKVEDGIVPAGVGVVLQGEARTYSVPVVKTAKTNLGSDNELVGITEPTMVKKTEGEYTNYILANEISGVGFYLAADGEGATLRANRAYLHTATAAAAPTRFLKMVNNGEATGIAEIENAQWTVAEGAYDLQGHRVSQPQQRGLYIVNGKKVVAKK